MPTPTYTPLATVTLGSSASSVTFSSIPATYRDLIIVLDGTSSQTDSGCVRFNGDSGNNYSTVLMGGNGSTTFSDSIPNSSKAFFGTKFTNRTNAIIQVMDYSATDKHKTFLARESTAQNEVRADCARWANTAAITSIELSHFGATNFSTGSTFSLYGVIA